MPRKLAAATVAILLGLTASPSRADDVNFLEISLLKYLPNGTNLYGIAFEAGKDGATSCEVTTPSGTSACIDTALRLDLTQAELTAEIGTGTGADWTLTWDKGLSTETTALIDFGIVPASAWRSLPTISNPLDGASGVSPDTSIDWTWPPAADLSNVGVVLLGPNDEQRESDELPLDTTSWTPLSPLGPGPWQAVVLNRDDIAEVPEGLSISGDTWVLENDEWLAAESIDISSFTVGLGAVCGNDVVETGEQCDDGNTDPGDCCSPTCQYEPPTTVCRASAGVCDLPELCTGVADSACPGDAFEPEGSPCDDGDVCTVEDVCNSGICSGSPAPDFDEDGFCDDADNCPVLYNPVQENSDALPAGDVCQCGDLDGDGVVDGDDVTIARQHLVGATIAVSYDLTRCNVTGLSNGGVSDCDVADIFVLERVIEGSFVAVENTCQAYTGP